MILSHHGCTPKLDPSVFVAPSCDLIGEVSIGAESSLWFQVVVRGDVNSIKIGSRTNIQDHSMLHVTRPKQKGTGSNEPSEVQGAPLVVGDEVTVGHRVTLHGCTIGNRVLIGMGAIVMDHAVVGEDCIIGAGALITGGTVIPSGSLVIGAPAQVKRPLTQAEVAFLKKSADNYVKDSREYIQLMGEIV